MRRTDWLIVAGLMLSGVGYWLTTLGTHAYSRAPDWVWYFIQQRPTLVMVGMGLALLGAYSRLRRVRQK